MHSYLLTHSLSLLRTHRHTHKRPVVEHQLRYCTTAGTRAQRQRKKVKEKGTEKKKERFKRNHLKKKECGYHGNPHPPTHTPSLHFHSLSRSLSLLSPPSLHLCAGDARVSFLSIRFVLTSPGRAPLTLPTDDTRGGGGGRGDEEKLLSLFSQLSITLKKRKTERETRPEQQPKERTHRIYIHTYKRKRNPTLLHSPFQGGHFSSLSPPFLFYPDFFLWDPGFVKL